MRRGELAAIQWPQVDFESGYITLEKGETKNDDARSVPILEGDMCELLMAAKKDRDEQWPHSPWSSTARANRSGISDGHGIRLANELAFPISISMIFAGLPCGTCDVRACHR
jgi:integrase